MTFFSRQRVYNEIKKEVKICYVKNAKKEKPQAFSLKMV